jgi:hypothetical protein
MTKAKTPAKNANPQPEEHHRHGALKTAGYEMNLMEVAFGTTTRTGLLAGRIET